MLDQAQTRTVVVRNDAQYRYEVWFGDTLAGFAEFRGSGAEIAFIHTEVDAEFSGKGLGEALIRHAITDATAREQAIVPRCSAVKSWLDKHPEFDAQVVGKGIKR